MHPRRVLFVSIAAILAGVVVIVTRTGAALPQDVRADKIVVEKSKRQLSIYSDGEILKTYKIALGPNPEGHKQQEGDGRTPEGGYVIDYRNPQSSYHLSLHISYPSPQDREKAAERGVSPGGDIFVHGLPPRFRWVGAAHRTTDWTAGCIAVTNTEIDELWRAVPNGTPIEIRP